MPEFFPVFVRNPGRNYVKSVQPEPKKLPLINQNSVRYLNMSIANCWRVTQSEITLLQKISF